MSINSKRIACLIPPHYDIDGLLGAGYADVQTSFAIVDKIYHAIETLPRGNFQYRPDSALLPSEVVVRDLCNFDMSMGNGFSSCLGYGGGFTCFFRALRALRIIRHKKALALAEAVRDALAANGAREPSRFADDNHEGTDVDWDAELKGAWGQFWENIEKTLNPLDDGWFAISHCYISTHPKFDAEDPPLSHTICTYLDANRDLLRCRKENLL